MQQLVRAVSNSVELRLDFVPRSFDVGQFFILHGHPKNGEDVLQRLTLRFMGGHRVAQAKMFVLFWVNDDVAVVVSENAKTFSIDDFFDSANGPVFNLALIFEGLVVGE